MPGESAAPAAPAAPAPNLNGAVAPKGAAMPQAQPAGKGKTGPGAVATAAETAPVGQKAPEAKPETPPEPPKKRARTFTRDGKSTVMEFADEAHEQREMQRLWAESQDFRKHQDERDRFNRAREAAVKSGDPFELWKALPGNEGFNHEDFLLERTKAILDAEDAKKADPKGYELSEREKALKAREDALEQQSKAAEEAKTAAEAEQIEKQWLSEWAEEARALGFDKEFTNGTVLQRAADVFDTVRDRKLGWTTKQIFEHVGHELRTAGIHHVKSLRGQALLDALGPELVNEVRTANLAAVSAPPPRVTTTEKPERKRMAPPSAKDAMDGLRYGAELGGQWRFKR